jgi:urea carboxylase
VKSRILHLPLAYNGESVKAAVAYYMESVRKTAPYLPDNIEFIRRANGLDDINEIERIVFDASYLVMGLGDVYLGAPCAVPIDPRHRLLTSKYNPARIYTPEGAVGIGGVYMCIYGMDSPGGYQLIGRTVPIWNKYLQNATFGGSPWLFRCFDQIRFRKVTDE